ncbi:MAG: tetratricopeptide repeat protein [Candidatus Thermochlorobacter sp.]
MAQRMGDIRFMVYLLNLQGHIARDKGAYADAILTYKRALSLCDSSKQTEKEKAKLFNNLAIVHSRQGNYPQALDAHFQSLKIKEKLGDSLGIANSLANIGLIYKKQAQYSDALKMYAIALQKFKALDDDVGTAAVLNNIGAIYRIQGNYDSARVYYEASLEVERLIGKKSGLENPPDVATALVNLSDVYAAQNKLNLARKAAEEAFRLFKTVNDKSGLITATRTLGVIADREQKSKKAISYLQRSIEIATSLGEPEELRESYLMLAEVYEKIGDYANALAAYKNYHVLYDTLLNLEKAKAINALKTQFETEKKEKEIILLKQEKDLQALALSREELLRNAFIGISVLSVALALTAFRAFRVKQKSEQMLREKNQVLDNALRVAEEQRQIAEEANRIKTELLAIAAHDLRNPLQSISGFAELARENLQNLKADFPSLLQSRFSLIESFLERIYSSSRRMGELIKNLLETAVLESQKITLNRESADLSALVNLVVSDCEVQAQRKQQRLEVQTESDCKVQIDVSRIREVIENLITNAIKYSSEGKTIRVSCKRQEQTERAIESAAEAAGCAALPSILIAVQDEGQGLTEDDKAKLFKKFQRLSARPTGGESSTGLGLWICRQIVELHGGRIWAESAGRNMGTTFFVKLPTASIVQARQSDVLQ